MSALDSITNDGFSINRNEDIEVDLALISLKIALKAYFSTYRSFMHLLHIFGKSTGNDQETIDFNHPRKYCEACAECIVHFQHFAELVCKRFLRDDHPLLADEALRKAQILHKLIHQEPLTEE